MRQPLFFYITYTGLTISFVVVYARLPLSDLVFFIFGILIDILKNVKTLI
jgi:hypothetical protein